MCAAGLTQPCAIEVRKKPTMMGHPKIAKIVDSPLPLGRTKGDGPVGRDSVCLVQRDKTATDRECPHPKGRWRTNRSAGGA